ncbi:hypothetical protein A2U01_0047599, partial [Trifolium medium]|nr:hypothetical protein [Trifolium medium]
TIPRHPHRTATLGTNPREIDCQFARFMGRVLTPDMLGSHALYSWLMAPNYMTWYMKISDPYLEPLPPRDPSRPAKLDAIIHDEAKAEGQRTTNLVANMLEIWQVIHALMASGDIPQGSHPYLTLQQV